MTTRPLVPRILVIDDLFGRQVSDRDNEDRANLCGQFLLEDVTGDEKRTGSQQKIKKPLAQAVFLRGQTPRCASVGNRVENDLEGTLQFIRDGWHEWRPDRPRWSLVLLDLCFYTGEVTLESDRRSPGMPEGRPGDDDPTHCFGLHLLEAIHNEFPDLPVVILSSQARQHVKHAYSMRGALAFLGRCDPESFELLRKYLWKHGLIPDESGQVVGHSKALLLALRSARRAALNEQKPHLLIRGEHGVGKELLAEYVHRESEWKRAKPFVVVNSAALTAELFAAELFGIKRRVATEVDERQGLIKAADGGNLFFDEIKDMVPQAQAGILRVLEEGKVTPVGAAKAEKIDVRFLSATNADIEALAAAGTFRGDLLERLRAGGTILLPPLRGRKEDIPDLVHGFVREAEQSNLGAMQREIDPAALEKLCDYDWPGNVRELRNCVFQAINNNPDVEYLVPSHIHVPRVGQPSTWKAEPGSDRDGNLIRTERSSTASHADEIISAISRYEFDPRKPAELVGRLSDLETAGTHLMASYLRAALIATSRATPERPEGEFFIHPAVKLITGDSTISASKAADVIKRLVNPARRSFTFVLQDSVLNAAFETAQRLRPSNPKKRKPYKS